MKGWFSMKDFTDLNQVMELEVLYMNSMSFSSNPKKNNMTEHKIDETGKLKQCIIIDLPKISDPRGNLTFIESGRHIPFEIKRIFYLYDVPGGAVRAGHALKSCHQFLIAASGSFDVITYDGDNRQHYHLNRSYYGLHIPPLIWREIENFSSGSVCMVLASEFYDESDYYRDFDQFLTIKNKLQK
jgi:dTDP-4-dehydrorhamnose 3,5-epimerase-like enzyme